MPAITRYFIKAAMLYFAGRLLIGFLISARTLLNLPAVLLNMTPTYLHMLVVGWITQLIIGCRLLDVPQVFQRIPAWRRAFGMGNLCPAERRFIATCYR